MRVLDTQPGRLTGFDANGNSPPIAQSLERRTAGQGNLTRRYRVAGKRFTFGGAATPIPATAVAQSSRHLTTDD